MRRFFLFLVPALAFGAVTNVQVTGVTPTQAVISYTAPDASACTVAVSASPTYSPLVPDVDSTIFTGANLDSRFTWQASGTHRVFVVGTRAPQWNTAGTPNTTVASRALAAGTQYFYQITCTGGATASGSFITATIPLGTGYGEQIPIDPNTPGNYLYPSISSSASRSASYVEPHTGAVVSNLTLASDVSGGGGTAAMTDSGGGDLCDQAEVTTSDGLVGYHCQLYLNNTPALYWIQKGGTSKRFLGFLKADYRPSDNQSIQPCKGVFGHSFSSTDPNTFYCAVFDTAQYVRIEKGVYFGHGWSISAATLSSIVVSGNTATLTFFAASGLTTSNSITISNSGAANLDGSYTVASASGSTATVSVSGVSPGTYAAPAMKVSAAGFDSDQTGLSATTMIHAAWFPLQNYARDLNTLVNEFDPLYATYGMGCCNPPSGDGYFEGGDWSGTVYNAYWWKQQDAMGWVIQFDIARTSATQQAQFGSTAGCIDNPPVTGSAYSGVPGCIIASTGSSFSPPNNSARWTVLHNSEGFPTSSLMFIAMNTIKDKWGVYYSVTLPSGLSATPSTCSMSKPAGSAIADWPDSSWAYGCNTITVSGDPTLSTFPTSSFPQSFPAAPGDFLSINSDANWGTREIIRLLDKGSDGNTWYIQRKYIYPQNAYSSVAANGDIEMLPSSVTRVVGGTGASNWWDGKNWYQEVLPATHTAYSQNNYGRWSVASCNSSCSPPGYAWQSGFEPARFSGPIYYFGAPGFNGYGVNMANINVEAHPGSAPRDPPDAAVGSQIVDNHPYYGANQLVTSSTVSLVTGQLYRIRGASPSLTASYKLVPLFANSGSRAMQEESGPGVSLATDSSTQFQWCAALANGECYSGSLAGDIYFNAPSVADAYCVYNWTTLQTTTTVPNDICVEYLTSIVQGVRTQGILSDPTATRYRLIASAVGKYDAQLQFWNSRFLPDGSGIFTSVPQDNSIKLFSFPPEPRSDSIDRQAYIPVTVSGAGIANAVVEFGYAEFGDPGSGRLFCTARQENCVAQQTATTVSLADPFRWASIDSHSGVACTSGCSVTVPGISGHVLFYRWNNAALTAPGPIQVITLP